jgi:D-sedoheptulose 7-phosphate isomerase
MKTPSSFSGYLSAHARLHASLDARAFQTGIDLIQAAFERGNQIFTCGNGGSAHTASHYVTDWNNAISSATGMRFRGRSLSDNSGIVTALANDSTFTEIFSGQLAALLDPNDLLIAISGSGNSPNVVRAVEYANEAGAETLAVVGYDGGQLRRVAKQAVWVPSFDMQLCEDIHLMFGHMVMKALSGTYIDD